jgi:hypothetical protein
MGRRAVPFVDGHFVQLGKSQGLGGDVVRAITIGRDDSLWVATDEGLSDLPEGHFRNYTVTDGLSSNRVVAIYLYALSAPKEIDRIQPDV